MLYLPRNLIDEFVANVRQYEHAYPLLTRDQLCIVALLACKPYNTGDMCRLYQMSHTELEMAAEDILRAGVPLKFYGLDSNYYMVIGDVDGGITGDTIPLSVGANKATFYV